MLERIKKYVQEHQMLKTEDCVVLGVSGGADSVCLLFVLLELQKEIGFRLEAVHVNHGLRGEDANADEAFVKNLCEEHGVRCSIYFENVELLAKKWKQSTEEAGRNFRRDCFEKTLEACGGTKIALAHHKNDNAETFLMNLARGTGLKGLGGIVPVQGNRIRPLLCVERKEIEAYLAEHHISYREDATNAEDEYTRNRVRHHLIPFMEEGINSKAVEHMDETMNYLRQVQLFMEAQVEDCWKACVREENEGWILLKEPFVVLPEVLQSMVLKKVLVAAAGKEKDLEQVHVRELGNLLEKQVGRKLDFPYQVEAKRIYEGIRLAKKIEMSEKPMETVVFSPGQMEYVIGEYHISCQMMKREDMKKCTEKGGTKWLNYDIIKDEICFRTRRPGDYITIDEAGNTQKLKAYFINNKIPQEERDKILLIADGNHIICVWGYRWNPVYNVTDHTEHVLGITADKGE